MLETATRVPSIDWRNDLPEAEGSIFRFNGYHYWIEGVSEPRVQISIERLHLLRKTPKGGWYVPEGFQGAPNYVWQKTQAERLKRFVLDSGRKRFAYPTKDEAWNSFKIRTGKRVQHCKNALNVAETLNAAIQQYEARK